ncbi:MAG: hypothetical protein ABIZ91_10135 [Gemmatimonadaceae bacterium]
MSDQELPDSAAFRQLEQLVRNLGDELASFRRRALSAESRVRALETAMEQGGDSASLERLKILESENADLKARIAFATERTRQLQARVLFLRQQQARPIPGVASNARSSGGSGGAS